MNYSIIANEGWKMDRNVQIKREVCSHQFAVGSKEESLQSSVCSKEESLQSSVCSRQLQEIGNR